MSEKMTDAGHLVPLSAYRDLYRAYVRLLESAHDRITFLGGSFDLVEVMERNDIDLRKAREVIESCTAQQPVAQEAALNELSGNSGQLPAQEAASVPVAEVTRVVNGSYGNKHNVEFSRDVPAGTLLYAAPPTQQEGVASHDVMRLWTKLVGLLDRVRCLSDDANCVCGREYHRFYPGLRREIAHVVAEAGKAQWALRRVPASPGAQGGAR